METLSRLVWNKEHLDEAFMYGFEVTAGKYGYRQIRNDCYYPEWFWAKFSPLGLNTEIPKLDWIRWSIGSLCM